MKSQTNRGELLLRGPGKDKLLAYARSFEGLSRSFYYLPDQPPQTNNKRELLWHNRLMENRLVLASELREVAKILTGISEEMAAVEDIGTKREDRVAKALKREGVTVKDMLLIENKDRRIEMYLTAKADWGNRIATDEIAQTVSRVLKCPMVASREAKSMIGQEFTPLQLEEEPPFHVLTGFVGEMKDSETESGDSYSITYEKRGRLILSLSDGMGSGPIAAYESRIVIELLEQFLESGFDIEAAVMMINGAMLGRDEEHKISTLDVCDINLYTGYMRYLKAGASPTFLKRDEKVQMISSESAPLGIFHEVNFDKGKKKLYDGDILVMITDGVLDRFGTMEAENRIQRELKRIKSKNPKEIAGKLMDTLYRVSEDGFKDDVSILAASIWRNE